MIGRTVSHYKIAAKIGEGGMGEVYLAEDTDLKRQVALKFLPEAHSSNPEIATRFQHEAQAGAALSHPNIVTIHEVSEHDGRPYIAMEYVVGPTLAQYCETKECSIGEILDLTIQIGEGLGKAHDMGIVHRDLKPANVMIDRDGRPKILDFGLAKLKGVSRVTHSGATLGTAAYMSSEQSQGRDVNHSTDLWSLGVILYEMVTRHLPFTREHETAIAYAIASETSHPLARYTANVPPELQQIVSKCLAKDPAKRYQSAADVIADLRAVRQVAQTLQPPQPIPQRRRPAVTVAAVSLSVLALIVLLLVMNPAGRRSAMDVLGLASAPQAKHLAVLPFATLGATAAGQAFSDGLIETLTSRLTQLEQFQGTVLVIPTSEIRSGRVASARQARTAFGVTHAVTGSVQYLGDQARVTVNLVDTQAERQLRSFVIDDYRANVTALQDSVVLNLAMILEVELEPGHRNMVAAGGTTVAEAYHLYLQGQGYMQRLENVSQTDTAITLFQQAVESDARYARAWAGLGSAYWRKYTESDDRQWIGRAAEACRQAIQLDHGLPTPHITLGQIHSGTGRYEEAIRELKLALQLDRRNHHAYQTLASVHETLAEIEQAEATYRKVIKLKPDYWFGYRDLLLFYLRQGRHDEALQYLDDVVTLNPDGFRSWNDIGAVYYYLDRQDEARRMWERSTEIGPNYQAYSNLGSCYYMSGQYGDAARMY